MSPEAPDKRHHDRHAYQIPCDFRVGGSDYCGFVINISTRGFFIQANVVPTAGREILVDIRTDPGMKVVGSIARFRGRHRNRVSMDSPGIGVRVDSAPEAYYQLVMMLEDKGLARA